MDGFCLFIFLWSKKGKEEEEKRAKEKGKSLNPVLSPYESQIRKLECQNCSRHFSGVKKKICTLSLKAFLLPVT